MNRRTLLKALGAGTIISSVGAGAFWAGTRSSPFGVFMNAEPTPLPILPLMDLVESLPERISLKLVQADHDFGTGALSQTLGINANYLGPALRVKSGQTLPFDVQNTLTDPIALHWHGLHIPGNVDGGPHQEILPGEIWMPDVPIAQGASTNWFHSHTHGKTARQVYQGLAGVLIVEDDESLSADLPNTYGLDDLTIVLQDKLFDAAGKLFYTVTPEVFEDGLEGDTLVVNGAVAPVFHTVPAGLVRVRILNACSARFLEVSRANGAPLTVIASDGGFLATPVETDTLVLSSGERYELVLDTCGVDRIDLRVAFIQGQANAIETVGRVLSAYPPITTALTLIVDSATPGMDASMPKTLANLAPPKPEAAKRVRDFHLDMGTSKALAELAILWGNFCGAPGSAMGINGQPMQMDRIDQTVSIGETEIWRITADDMQHPFHIHGCSFRILKQRGTVPPDYAHGWKDMVTVEGQASEVLVTFNHLADSRTPYMYHCHILEHEDCGMMGQFTVS